MSNKRGKILKGINKFLLIGVILLIVGCIWAFVSNRIGLVEWLLLLSGILLGIFVGMVQRWAVNREKRGEMKRGIKTLWVTGTIIVLIFLKVTLNIVFPSYLATSMAGIWLSIIFAIGGLLLGHSIYYRKHLNSNSK